MCYTHSYWIISLHAKTPAFVPDPILKCLMVLAIFLSESYPSLISTNLRPMLYSKWMMFDQGMHCITVSNRYMRVLNGVQNAFKFPRDRAKDRLP